MKKRICIKIMLIIATFYMASFCANIHDLKEKIFHRMYLIQRLEAPIKAIHLHGSNTIDCSALQPFLFECNQIKLTETSLCKDQNLRCIKSLLRSFLSYRHLEDETFERDIIKLITLLYVSITGKQPTLEPEGSLQKIIDTSDKLSDADYANNMSNLLSDRLNNINPNDVALRWYYIQRLKGSMKWLALYEKNNAAYSFCPDDKLDFLKNDILTKYTIRSSNPIKMVLNLWEAFKKFKFVQDYVFTKEFIALLALIFKNIYMNSPAQSNIPYETLVEIHDHLESLPVEHLLHIIDNLADNLIEEGHTEAKTTLAKTKEWLSKNWWFPASIGGFILYKIRQHYFGKPKPPYSQSTFGAFNAYL